MKSKFTTIILFLVMIFLIVAMGIFGMAIYLNITNIDSIDKLYYTVSSNITNVDKENKENTTNINEAQNDIVLEDVHINNQAKEKYYYEQLNETQKEIYNGLFDNKENMRDGEYTIQYGGIFSDILKTEEGKKQLGQDYQSAVETFLYDNPDVFYIDANKLYLNVETTTTIIKQTHNVYIGPVEGETYFVDGFTSKSQVNTVINKIEKVKDKVISNITGDSYKDILKIHDYLVESIDYDSDYASIGTYSIYGALIDNRCVCEGYAKALKYLLNAANIPCEIVQGTANNSAGKVEKHAWNIVSIDEKWYYIDATWDDPIIIGQGSVSKSIQYKYFLKGSKVFDKDHKASFKFSDNGKLYRYPIAEEYNYK